MVVQAAESASTLGEKHETNLFVDDGKGVKEKKRNGQIENEEENINIR